MTCIMKDFFASIINLILIANLILGGTAYADTQNTSVSTQLKIGDYFTVGKYNGEAIVWRYLADDENGKLMVSDKMLCKKLFGISNLWKDSFVRMWLNSVMSSIEGDWSESPYFLSYLDVNEKGFLHEDNYSQMEKNVMKSVTQWTMLPDKQEDLSENGIDTVYNGEKEFVPGSPRDGGYRKYYSISELPEHYFGAAYETTDKIFLLDEMQIYNIWKNFGNVGSTWLNIDEDYYSYYLRTPFGVTNYCISGKTDPNQNTNEIYNASIGTPEGIRPAFYLDEDNAVILSGSGTEEDPFVMDGKSEINNEDSYDSSDDMAENEKPSGISVFFNDSEISFDQSPFIENDRVLVPMRAIFETLGAEVLWNEEKQSITATAENNTIVMQIGNETIIKNGEVIKSEVAPKLIGDRTFVPLRVISESFGADVDWNEDSQRVIITRY